MVRPFTAVEVPEMMPLERIRKPPRIGEHVGRLVEGRHVTIGWSGGWYMDEPTFPGERLRITNSVDRFEAILEF